MTMNNTYKATIGLEVHAELNTKSKMFCGCTNDPHHGEPNQYICPVCTAQPGTLPVVNEQAVASVIQVGIALGSNIASFTEFDRKNYFYPDIPKAYQISQYEYPLVSGGELAGVAITRVHLEEDTARSQHDVISGSVVDFNRCGVPLMELVTEPVIHDAATAGMFARELQLLLRTLEVSNANMEKGEMRVEANISVSKTTELGTKVEVKNLNSFKVVEAAIVYEIERQTALLEAGEKVLQETRGWDEAKSRTYSQRSKETANDYRYFPDPDITKFDLTQSSRLDISRLSEIMPMLPVEYRKNWSYLGIKDDIIEVLLADKTLRELYTATCAALLDNTHAKQLAANYIASDVQGLLAQDVGAVLHENAPQDLAELSQLLSDKKINSRIAKDLLYEAVISGISPVKLSQERGLLQESSEAVLLDLVKEIVAENAVAVSEFQSGKIASLQFLVGQGMKKSRGTANPAVLKSLIEKEIS